MRNLKEYLAGLFENRWIKVNRSVRYTHRKDKVATLKDLPHNGMVAINYHDDIIYMNKYGSIVIFKLEKHLCLVREQSKSQSNVLSK